MPSVTVREYNPCTGAFVGNLSQLSFGGITAGTTSAVKVVDFAFVGVSTVSSVKVGLTSAAGITVNGSPQNITSDATASNGRFGIQHSTDFDTVTAGGPLTRHFAGLNATGSAADSFNVEVGTRNPTTSQFVYIDIELPGNFVGAGAGAYKIFFDFE